MAGFDDHLHELFAPLGGVTFRRMFSGTGVFRNGLMFALLMDDVLHLKADATTSPMFEAEGCSPWVYETSARRTATSYWRAPDRLLDSPDEFAEWARAAYAVAERAKKPVKAPKKKRAVRGKTPGGR